MSYRAGATKTARIQSKGIRVGRRVAPPPLVVPAEGSTVHALDEHGDAVCGAEDRLYPLSNPWPVNPRYACAECVARTSES